MESTMLTPEYINSHIGEIIKWYAFGYKGNFPMKGKCKLLGIAQNPDRDNRIQPVIEHIAGDDLSYGWVEDGYITYSDSDRPVYVGEKFELYNIVYDVPTMGFTKATGNPMHVGLVHWLSKDIHEEIKKVTTATDYDLILIV